MLKLKDQRQDGRINIIFKIFLSITLFLFQNNISASNLIGNGSIVLIPLEDNEKYNEYQYKNNIVTRVLKDNKPYLLFGIPYHSSPGMNTFEFKSDNMNKIINLSIRKKHFTTQNININKYREKTKEELERIYKEKEEIQKAKNIRYDNFPDFNFITPTNGIVTGVYGTQRYYNGVKGRYHNGHDIAADIGTPIFSPSKGKIILTGNYYYNGKFVMINHGNNLISIFLHMNQINVSKGSIVEKGEIIGTVGNTGLSTGPHLHWSVMLNNVYVDPIEFIKKVKAELDK